ncbi:DUF494 family protein [Paludibacterium paludis]|uniref:Protein Smg homolog n=1 Tax=Paludibacterium paludis TaxID=1225769 RepID=A0A918NZV1_9NEIS|nr:DUF494 domain-containing protein [Paludibacterium paludis]GGY09739.1 protein Smg [Paludibacterium paludis]
MFDVLAYLFEEYRDPEACEDRARLVRSLSAAGFEDEEIQDALDWLYGVLDADEEDFAGADSGIGMRIYTEEEQDRLPMDVRGLIQFLEDNGALSGSSRERVIDRLMALPGDITVMDAKLVALIVLWALKAELPVLIGEELMNAVHGEPTMQ